MGDANKNLGGKAISRMSIIQQGHCMGCHRSLSFAKDVDCSGRGLAPATIVFPSALMATDGPRISLGCLPDATNATANEKER